MSRDWIHPAPRGSGGRTRAARRPSRAKLALPFLAGAFIGSLACLDDEPPLLPDLGPSRQAIRGQIRVAARGASALLAISGPSEHGGFVRVQARTAPDGRFLVPLPVGTYLMEVGFPDAPLQRSYWYSREGPVSLSRFAEGIRVRADSAITADLDFGAIDLRLTLPPSLRPQPPEVDPQVSLSVWSRSMEMGIAHVSSPGLRIEGDTLVARLAPLPADRYSILVHLNAADVDRWLPGVPDPERADSIAVGIDATAIYRGRLALSAGRLRGKIKGAWERLTFRRPHVFAFDPDSSKVGGVRAADSGAFLLTVIGADRVRLFVTLDAFGRWIGGEDFAEATWFTVAREGETVVPAIEDGGLLVRLTGPRNDRPWDMVYRVRTETGRVVAGDRYRASGDFLPIAGLAPGRYRLYLEPAAFGAQGWIRQWFDQASTPEQATLIPVPAGGRVVPLTVALEPGGAIRGVLREPSGACRTSTTAFALFLVDADTCLARSTVGPSGLGEYEIAGLPEGSYKLVLGPPVWIGDPCGPTAPRGWIWYGQTAARDSAQVITIRDHATIEGIDVELPPREPGAPPPPGD